MTPALLVELAPSVLLAGAVLQLLLGRLLSARAKGVLAVASCLPALAAVLAALPAVWSGAAIDLHLLFWDGPLTLALHVDALSVLFALMGTGIGLIVLLYSIDYMAADPAATRFYALMLTFIGGLVGLVYSSNLFLMYACWELVGLCSFGLVGFWYRDPEPVKGARKVLLMTHLAGYGLLAAIVLIYGRAGTAIWTDPAVTSAFTGGIFVLMLVALIAKSVQFPLHTWIPDAMAAPTPVSALLHAACYVKAGVYLAARMHSFGPWQPAWGTLMIWVGTVTMIVGVLYAMIQSDLKRMLAFHTVSQIGYMITGLGIGTPLGITAALLHCLNHGFFKGGLFMAAGSVQHAAGTRDMNRLGGLAARMPQTTFAWLIGTGCIMGVPLMSGFTGKWMLYGAALQAGVPVVALAAWLASLGTVFSFAKATSSVFLGAPSEVTEHAHESPSSMCWGLGLISAGSIVLSIAPQLPIRYLLNPVLGALGMGAGLEVSWFGLAGPTGSWFTTWGLVLAIVSVVAGWLVYALAMPVKTVVVAGGALAGAGGGVFTGGEPLSGEGRLPASDFSAILKHHWHAFYAASNVDAAYQRVWQALQALAAVAGRLTVWAEKRTVLWTVLLAAGAFAAFSALPITELNAAASATEFVPPLFAAACGAACLALCLAALATPAWRRLALPMLAAGGCAVCGLIVPQPNIRLALMEGATLLTLVLVWRSAAAKKAVWTFFAVVLVSGAALIAGQSLLHGGDAGMTRALLGTGFLLKLAAGPLLLWLLSLADDLPALVSGLMIAVVDIAVVAELFLVAQSAPWILTPYELWLGVAVFSALGGSLLMLCQTSLKRLLVLSTVEDIGFLLLGLASANALGLHGAMLGAAVHAMAKALLFICISRPEADGALTPDARGLASRYPLSAAGFLFGMLAMLGVPPALGFAGRWRLYETASQAGPLVLVAFIASSIFALVAYTLALTRVWWGPAQSEKQTAREPFVLGVVVVLLILLLVGAGLWPNSLQVLTGGM